MIGRLPYVYALLILTGSIWSKFLSTRIQAFAVERLIIEAGRTEGHYWRDLWRYRELFYFLAWGDILIRYKQTAIGGAWSLIRPVLTMLVFTVIFSRVAGMPSDGAPYPVLVFCGMLPWQFFA